MSSFRTNFPATVFFNFKEPIAMFIVYDKKGEVYFFRETNGKNKLKVNFPQVGSYTTNVETAIKIEPIKIKQRPYDLPPFEKNFFFGDKTKFVHNKTLTGTPARNFYKKGVIEYSSEFLKLPYPVRLFILCHETAHSFYHDESKADICGVKIFLDLGYNASTAFYALRNILYLGSERNQQRLINLYNKLK